MVKNYFQHCASHKQGHFNVCGFLIYSFDRYLTNATVKNYTFSAKCFDFGPVVKDLLLPSCLHGFNSQACTQQNHYTNGSSSMHKKYVFYLHYNIQKINYKNRLHLISAKKAFFKKNDCFFSHQKGMQVNNKYNVLSPYRHIYT